MTTISLDKRASEQLIMSAGSKQFRMVIAEQETLFLQGLQAMLETEGWVEVVGTASSGTDLLATVRSKKPDIVLTNLALPTVNGIDVSRAITNEYPESPDVLLIGDKSMIHHVPAAFEAGASGFILKSASKADLCNAIEQVLLGNVYVCPEASELFTKNYLQSARLLSPMRAGNALSLRELELVQLLGEGLIFKEISEAMLISTSTVEAPTRYIKVNEKGRPDYWSPLFVISGRNSRREPE
jgi:DNA-binding NarL/FixJ family response regulator